MSDADEGRDVHAAFGTLLADEPPGAWSAVDDVARGRALQRRRRTRAGAGIGLVAAAVMVFGVFGPWRPKPAAVAPPASSSVELEQQVTDMLADLGWETDVVARVSNEPGSPEIRAWTAHRTDGDTDVNAKLVLRTWDERSWKAAVNPTSVIAGCDQAGACANVTRTLLDCASADGCWSSASTTTNAAYTALPEGSYVLYTYNEIQQRAVEIVVEPLVCITCSARPLPPFLTEQETAQVAAVVQQQIATTPSPTLTPSGQPIAACTNDMVKIVPAVDLSGAGGQRSVALEVYARNPSVSCTVEGFPSATVLVDGEPAQGLVYTQGTKSFPGADRGVAVLVDEAHAAVFVVATDRCDAGTAGRAGTVAVRLPGSATPTSVELPDGLAPELCADVANEAGQEVWVSGFTLRAGGVE